MDDDLIQMLLKNIGYQLAMIPTADLQAYNQSCRDSLSQWHSMGHILDPTAYRDAMYSGELDDAQAQLKIADHFLAARRAIDERNVLVAQVKTRKEDSEAK